MTHHMLDLLRAALVHYGYWAVAAALLLENAGLPVPGESILLLASFLAYSEGELQFGRIVLVGTIAATIGDNIGYVIGYYGGRPLLLNFGRAFRVNESALRRGEKLFADYGPPTIFCAVRIRYADHRRAAGGGPTHELEAIRGFQFAWCCDLGHGDFLRGIFLRQPVECADSFHEAVRHGIDHSVRGGRGCSVAAKQKCEVLRKK